MRACVPRVTKTIIIIVKNKGGERELNRCSEIDVEIEKSTA